MKSPAKELYLQLKLYNLPYTDKDEGALRRNELVNWYLEQVEAELQSEQELTERKVLVEKVLERLVKVVSDLT